MDAFEYLKTTFTDFTLWDGALLAVWGGLFGAWLVQSRFGTAALQQTPTRRNTMSMATPFIPLLIWFCVTLLGIQASQRFSPQEPPWIGAMLDNLALCIGGLAGVVASLIVARRFFARGLAGFGLRIRTLFKDAGWAVAHLLAVWPLVFVVMILTIFIGKLIVGGNFEMPVHQELQNLKEYSEPALQWLILVTATVVAPVTEEILFRGIFQTAIRNNTARPWFAVIGASAVFSIIHADSFHWPALFVLSVGLGYAYEKSGSLWRPIIMHMIFNTVSVVATLHQTGKI